MKAKDRLRILLEGGVPDVPPHFELVYQIEDRVFGMPRCPEITPRDLEDKDFEEKLIRQNIDLQKKLIETYEWAAVYPVYHSLRGIEELKKAVEKDALVFAFDWDGAFFMPDGNGIMDFVIKLFEEPQLLHQEARKKCDSAKIRLKQMADAGLDFFFFAYDFGYNEGPFISPEHFKEIVTPYLTELVEFVHSMKMKVLLHSDGDLRLILDQIYGTGIDGYQSIDPQGHMDIRKVREEYPDWMLMGNVKTSMLQETDEEAIRLSVQKCMKYGGIGSRYVFSTSNCIFAGMPPESYHIMIDEYKKIISGDRV